MKWAIEIQATNKTWFADHELPVTTDPVKGDERIAELRRQGFKARGRMIVPDTENEDGQNMKESD